MKPFSLFLLLIGSGILFALLSRPFDFFVALGCWLRQLPTRFPVGRVVSAGFQAAGSHRNRSLAGDGWRQAAQF